MSESTQNPGGTSVKSRIEAVADKGDPWAKAMVLARENDKLRAALAAIRDHGETHDQPCWALHNGDCADVMQEIARAALGEVS